MVGFGSIEEFIFIIYKIRLIDEVPRSLSLTSQQIKENNCPKSS
jgi:hypothetical protein